VKPENLQDVVTGISKMNFAGYNVTIPHKIQIMQHLDHVHELARVIGAVNVVTLKDGVATGYNTDGEGFLRSLETEADISVAGKSCFILGCGGAARAIAMTLAFKGAAKVFICNRTATKAQDLAKEINEAVRPCSEALPLDDAHIAPALRQADVLINTTSVGMHPKEDAIPVDPDLVPHGMIVSDIVYNPVRTRLLQVAESKGCKTVTGLGMLVYQGAEAFRMWTGAEPPVAEMFEVVRALKG